MAFKQETSASYFVLISNSSVCSKYEALSAEKADQSAGNNVQCFFWFRWIFYALILHLELQAPADQKSGMFVDDAAVFN